jgi:drug/metabolite transporter, DME family
VSGPLGRPRVRRATLYTLVAAILWGTSFPAIRAGLEHGGAGPFTLAAARFVLAAAALALVALILRRAAWTPFRSPAVWALALLNALGYALQFAAQEHTTASKTSLLVDIDVVFIALLGYAFLGERHGRRLVAGLVLGLVGVVLLSTGGDPGAATLRSSEFMGDALAFAAGLAWAFYFVGVKGHLRRHPTTDGLAFTLAVVVLTAAVLLPWALLTEGTSRTGDATAWTLAAYLALGPTALAFFLWQAALRTEGVTATSVLLLLEIVVAVGLGYLLLDERLEGLSLAGAGLIVAAAYLAAREAPAAEVPQAPLPAAPPQEP